VLARVDPNIDDPMQGVYARKPKRKRIARKVILNLHHLNIPMTAVFIVIGVLDGLAERTFRMSVQNLVL
jgi:hypothetical protein